MRVNIVLPDFSRLPIGGLKVQYEFANRLARIGYDVAVYHDRNFDQGFVRHPRNLLGLVRWNLRGSAMLDWFPLDPSVRCYFLPVASPHLLRRTDVTLFNSFLTADKLPRATARTGRLLELVYEYPVWKCGTREMRDHLAKSLQRPDVGHIPISTAVEDMLNEIGVHSIGRITCGIDLPDSSLFPPTSDRAPIVAFPLRPEAHKGARDMLDAIPRVAANHPDVHFECFGRYDQAVAFPDNLKRHGYLDDQQLVELYQRCMIFVLPSHAEGWGLPAAEAMANGAALVVADNGGSMDFTIDHETALVAPISNPQAIADAVSTLLSDDALRSKIVKAAIAQCSEMTWDKAVAQLVSLFPSV